MWPELRSDGSLAPWGVMLYNLERQIHTPKSELDIYHTLDVASRSVLWNSSIVDRLSAEMALLDLEDTVWSVSREMILSDVGADMLWLEWRKLTMLETLETSVAG